MWLSKEESEGKWGFSKRKLKKNTTEKKKKIDRNKLQGRIQDFFLGEGAFVSCSVFSLEREWLQLSRYSRRDKVPLVLKHLYTVCHTGHKANTCCLEFGEMSRAVFKNNRRHGITIKSTWWRSNWLTDW